MTKKTLCMHAENTCCFIVTTSRLLQEGQMFEPKDLIWNVKLVKTKLTCIPKSFILVPCWRSRLLSSFRSFCANSAAALFFWVRREAQTALYSTVLSSLGFPLGLSITPTRKPGLDFCTHTYSSDITHTNFADSHLFRDKKCHWQSTSKGESFFK